MADGGDVVMRPVPVAKGCTSEESGERCPCPQFALGGKDIQFVCVNCGHREAEHAPCVRKQYQFPIDQFNHRCGECGLYPSAHVAAEDMPCGLRREEFGPLAQLPPGFRCSGCGLDVGRHTSASSAKRPWDDSFPSWRVSFSVPNATNVLSIRAWAFRIASATRALRFSDHRGADCITYDGRSLPYALRIELFFFGQAEARDFIRRLFDPLGEEFQLCVRPTPMPFSPQPTDVFCDVYARDVTMSRQKSPDGHRGNLQCYGELSAGSPSESIAPDDLNYVALQPLSYYVDENLKPERCHIVAKSDGADECSTNILIMDRTLHSWFDGTPQMTSLRMPTLFISVGDPGDIVTVPELADRVFVPLRLLFTGHVASRNSSVTNLIKHRVVGEHVLGATSVMSTQPLLIQLYVGIQTAGQSPVQVFEAMSSNLATRPKPDVRPAPPLPEDLDQTPLEELEDHE